MKFIILALICFQVAAFADSSARFSRNHHEEDQECRRGRDNRSHDETRLSQAESIFTVSGIRLGYVSLEEMRSIGGRRVDPEYNYYFYDGFDFWFHQTNFVHHMYIPVSNEIPSEWTSQGIDRDLSYDEAYETLRNLGFTVSVIKQPTQEYYQPKNYYAFTAKLQAKITNRDQKVMTLQFDFNFEQGSSSTRGTLYSITAKVR